MRTTPNLDLNRGCRADAPFCIYNSSAPTVPTASTTPSLTPSGASEQQVGFNIVAATARRGLSCVTLLVSDGNTSLPPISLAQLIPPEKNLTSFYRYKGSLTTPGCTESVVWTLFESPIPLSADQVSTKSLCVANGDKKKKKKISRSFTSVFLCRQLRAFSELRFHDGKPMVGTFRPVQPLNGRLVFHSGAATILTSGAFLMAAAVAAFGLSQPN